MEKIIIPKENLARISIESDERYWDYMRDPSAYTEYESRRISDERWLVAMLKVVLE